MVSLLAALLLAGEAAGLAAQFGRDLTAFIIVAVLQGIVWAAAAAVVTRSTDRPHPLAVILGTAILLRLLALSAPVFLSDDINRYIWDGRVQAAGINPYRYIPADPDLARLRDEAIYPNINRNNYAPTIYPPVAQMLFLLANRVGETVLALATSVPPAKENGILPPDAAGFIYYDKAKFHAGFVAEQTRPKADFMYASQGPISVKAFVTPLTEAAWKTKPSFAIVATEDKSIDPNLERKMYKRAGAKVTELKGSHTIFMANAKAVTDVIEAAAKTINK